MDRIATATGMAAVRSATVCRIRSMRLLHMDPRGPEAGNTAGQSTMRRNTASRQIAPDIPNSRMSITGDGSAMTSVATTVISISTIPGNTGASRRDSVRGIVG